jgi:hypothetical protein
MSLGDTGRLWTTRKFRQFISPARGYVLYRPPFPQRAPPEYATGRQTARSPRCKWRCMNPTLLKLRDGEDEIGESPDHAASLPPARQAGRGQFRSERGRPQLALPILSSPISSFVKLSYDPLSCSCDQLALGLHLRCAGTALDDCLEGCWRTYGHGLNSCQRARRCCWFFHTVR